MDTSSLVPRVNTDFQDLAEHLKTLGWKWILQRKLRKGSIHRAPTHMGYDLPLQLRAVKLDIPANYLWRVQNE